MIGYDILQSTVGLGVVCLCGKTTTLLLLQLVTIVTATASDINTANQPTPTLAPSISSSSNPTAKPKVTTTATSDSQISNSDIAEADGPRLPFGDINVVVVTDVHSWVAGHGEKEPKLDADYGDILSFVQHLKTHFLQNEPERDLWFVMNGDWIDGTGLAMNRDPSHLIPLLEKMPWDALNVGNHELYEREVIEYATKPAGFVEWWGDRYLSSNVLMSASKMPMGNRYKVLQGKSNLLTFGFLFDMKDHSKIVTVESVENVVLQKWFTTALQEEEYDAILVLAHMGASDPLIQVILDRIRNLVGHHTPIQFLTGHTHYRDFVVVDSACTSFEAGRYLDTVGFVSFPTKSSTSQLPSVNVTTSDLFKHVFLDANVETLRNVLRVDQLPTSDGTALSSYIQRTRKEMGLEEVVGCLNGDLFLNNGLGKEDSLWRFFRDYIVPGVFGVDEVLFIGKGMWRYDLYGGDITLDNLLSVSPFNESFHVWENVPGRTIYDLNRTGNNITTPAGTVNPPFMPELPEFILCPGEKFDPNGGPYYLVTNAFESKQIEALLSLVDPAFVDKQPSVMNLTTTQLWIQHFSEERHIFGCSPFGKHFHGDHDRGQNSSAASTDSDFVWISFLLLAVTCVFVLSIWHVWQRSIIHRRLTYQRNFETNEALREYQDTQGIGYRDEDEDEGEFI